MKRRSFLKSLAVAACVTVGGYFPTRLELVEEEELPDLIELMIDACKKIDRSMPPITKFYMSRDNAIALGMVDNDSVVIYE